MIMFNISIGELFSQIESADFYANIALVNSVDIFLTLLNGNPSIRNLISLVSFEPSYLDMMEERIYRLWKFECDSNILHPYDHSIAVYLYVIFKVNKNKAEEILKWIYQNQIPNLYWAYQIYNYILRNIPRVITSYCDHHQIDEPERLDYININALNSK